jgi:hypothetical protein
VPKGHQVAWTQFQLPVASPSPLFETAGAPGLQVEEDEAGLAVRGDAFSLAFDKQSGRLLSWQFEGHDVVRSGPALNLWRAPTDNDARQFAHAWRAVGLDTLTESLLSLEVLDVRASVVKVRVLTAASVQGVKSQLTYVIHGTGDVVLEHQVSLEEDLPPLARVGVTLTVPEDYGIFTWYGRGPHESYVDRKTGAAVDVYRSTVDEEYVPYVKPQESGNKTDVRWAALTGADDTGLLAVGMPLLEVSAHRYTAHDLAAAKHTYQLKPRREIVLNLDLAQSGLGSASCGPGVLPAYQLTAAGYRYCLRLRPLTRGDSPLALATLQFPCQ